MTISLTACIWQTISFLQINWSKSICSRKNSIDFKISSTVKTNKLSRLRHPTYLMICALFLIWSSSIFNTRPLSPVTLSFAELRAFKLLFHKLVVIDWDHTSSFCLSKTDGAPGSFHYLARFSNCILCFLAFFWTLLMFAMSFLTRVQVMDSPLWWQSCVMWEMMDAPPSSSCSSS